ncbi:hypothetical protein [Hymenobacter sp. PAMC 26628]|uniref:hypothetical protein n=1 Tax=Hymenobacter sp. PAMC 26628 TaxID=1484118 RepID=UPI0007701EFC|nr:hypothetical protein [Hymenobacter sp. PAMC 26628]AMJ64459.1 hypothetical protein AXW84_02720 [Hymenobacter sp. PAMC 26628]
MFFSFLCAALLALGAPLMATPGAGAPKLETRRPASAARHGSVDPCKVYGSIYLETDPTRRNGCFGIVYVEPDQAFADLLVFKEENKLFADKAGLWAEAPNRDFADYVLFVTPTRGLADFTIHYTPVRSFAGCKTQ